MKIPLTLAVDYCRSWGWWQAVRELIANAIDTDYYHIDINEHSRSITIETYAGAIPNKYLLMGSGSKCSNGQTIGQHNEGLKLAMLVLARGGYELTIHNGLDTWEPVIEYSEMFEQEHLHVIINEGVNEDEDVVRFTITNLDDSHIEEVKNNYLDEYNIGKFYQCDEGKILLDSRHLGKIYCGGVWVCNDTNLNYGYDILPKHLSLDRDRQRVSTFDIQWLSKEMWSQVTNSGEDSAVNMVADMVEKRVADTLYLNHTLPSKAVASELFKRYEEKYSGKVLAESPEEVLKLEASGVSNAIYLGNDLFTNIVKSSNEYRTLEFKAEVCSVEDLMLEWKGEWGNEMSRSMQLAYDDLVHKIKTITN